MALVAALAAFASLASALADEEPPADPGKLEVKCVKEGTVTPAEAVKLTEDITTLTLTCPNEYTANPAPKRSSPEQEQMVYSTEDCNTEVPLKTYCSGATGQTQTNNWELQLNFPTVPSCLGDFYLTCTPPNGEGVNRPCKVHVVVQSKAPSGNNDSSNGGGAQQPGSGQGGAPAGVQTCLHQNKTITVRVPEKGSLAQFACESGSTLYPMESKKIFSKDCKTQETLKDMTRTQTTGDTSARDGAARPTYTLKADKKPAKKTLCYLCATAGTSADDPGTAKNYCTVYVESGAAGTQLGFSFIVVLALPCVPAVFQFT